MNLHAIRAIYGFEMARFRRTMFQSLFTPVLTTSLYFVVFGAAMGGRLHEVQGVPYGAFIIPGLMLLTVLSESIANASFGIYLPRFTGTIYELLSAPIGTIEALAGYVGAAASKSLILALVILATARCFVPYHIVHPLWAIVFLLLITVSFSLFGFILGCFADGFEKLQIVPLMIVTPLTFLGGTFYSVDMLPKPWSTITLFNPIVYLVNGLRWAFYGIADVNIAIAAGIICLFLVGCAGIVTYIFTTGWRLRT
ncbi:ABC-2 type transport system permease protein [Sphingomonas vulcanisoli]|uniref:Transport permease protein n=1 Tax=Sphingomonas vulcanisoli TaxID=1658060 RepID=A0ABX0TS19_9SPHN|nr:ABC transporter permease [Sphingomonas vulcanisoli]NIJ08256.1 ABC-2 type transport system permease protein [Sphingomonas vulcanisoli]